MQLDTQMANTIELIGKEADHSDEGTLDELARRLDLAEQLKMSAQQIIDMTNESLVDRMETDQVVIAGVGLLRRKSSQRSVWASKDAGQRFRSDVLYAIRTRASIDPETGEINEVAVSATQRAMELINQALPAFSSIKVEARPLLDIDVKDYRTTQWSNNIQIERGIVVYS
tara:strand:- start:7191 stop:7703 length:513 start_codon:yes stop_codon:yes gene_type:complete